MPDSYLRAKFNSGFIQNLMSLAKSNFLHGTSKKKGVVYLPFGPQFFLLVHTTASVSQTFSITYLTEGNLESGNHKLSYVTSGVSEQVELELLNKNVKEQDQYIHFSLSQMKQLCEGTQMSSSDVSNLLANEDDVEMIRYIVLTVISSETHCSADRKLTSKTRVFDYFLSDSNIISQSRKLRSFQLILPPHNPLIALARSVLNKLLIAVPNTPNGISIVADKPMNNPIQLNANRRAVLRQVYGLTLGNLGDGCALRPAFGYKNGRQAEGTDVRRIFVKPFCAEMCEMANYIHVLLMKNKELLGINMLDLSNSFNSCAILLYHRIPGVKEVSSMGWHTDLKYSKSGIFSNKANCQTENTVTVIVTIGESRILKWRQKYFDITNKSQINQSWFLQMLLDEGSILVLHPKDECPHYDKHFGKKVKYEHGNVNIAKDKCSVAFVFRHLRDHYKFDISDHHLLTEEYTFTNLDMEDKMDDMYDKFDIEKYHRSLLERFNSILA